MFCTDPVIIEANDHNTMLASCMRCDFSQLCSMISSMEVEVIQRNHDIRRVLVAFIPGQRQAS